MSAAPNAWFAEACKEPFAFLVQRHGFEGPILSPNHLETIVRYQKDGKTICIAMPTFGHPQVELTNAKGESVNHRVLSQTPLPPNPNLSDADALTRELRHCATEIKVSARDFLFEGESPPPPPSTTLRRGRR